MYQKEVLNTIQKVLESNRQTYFTYGRPGRKWFNLFLRRHPEIVKKNTEIISKARAAVTEGALKGWFRELSAYLKEEGQYDVMLDPCRIYNADETGAQFCPKSGKLLGPRPYKNFYEISSGAEKETVTVLCNYSASGLTVPPMVVFPYKRLPRDVAYSIPDEFFVGKSDSGLMISEVFYEYVSNCQSFYLLMGASPMLVWKLLTFVEIINYFMLFISQCDAYFTTL
jgi:hypothetical protein